MRKICIKCKLEKVLEKFYKLPSSKDGYNTRCKKCILIEQDKYRKENRETILKRKKEHYYNNKKEILEKQKIKRNNNIENFRSNRKKYKELNKERIREYNKNYSANRRLIDLNFKILGNLRNRLRLAIHNNQKSGTTLDLIDCDIEFLKKHLESQFKEGMNWENYGTYWSIEHNKACCLFDLSDPIQQKECFHWKNLSALTISENSRKGQEDKKLANLIVY
jgi:hypothetical protein